MGTGRLGMAACWGNSESSVSRLVKSMGWRDAQCAGANGGMISDGCC